LFKFLCTVLMALVGFAAQAETFVASPQRTLYVTGVVDGSVLVLAAQITDMAAVSTDPIDMVINSPGGSVVAGMQLLSAMDVAKARGVKFRCVVPVMAASMGFQILANCDERYALKYAMLLWHPVKISSRDGFSAEQLLYESDRIRAIERPLMRHLIAVLGITRKIFWYHYRHETLWIASEFGDLSPGFLTIVDDIQNVRDLFRIPE
jgi:ATP-dependent protease ClpP protease subunit